MPTRPWRGTPARKPTTAGTSLGSSRASSSARIAILAEREPVSVTPCEAATTSAKSVISAQYLTRFSARRGETRGHRHALRHRAHGGLQRRRVRDRDHAAGARDLRTAQRVPRSLAGDREPVAVVPRLCHELPHDRRAVAHPPRDLQTHAARRSDRDPAEPAPANDGLVPA